jgi:hypothetical protein
MSDLRMTAERAARWGEDIQDTAAAIVELRLAAHRVILAATSELGPDAAGSAVPALDVITSAMSCLACRLVGYGAALAFEGDLAKEEGK